MSERMPTTQVWVQIGAERTEHLKQMVKVVIRPLRDVLIQCDAAVPWVVTNVGARFWRQGAQPRDCSRVSKSIPEAGSRYPLAPRTTRLSARSSKPSSSARRCSRSGLMSRSTTSRSTRTWRRDHASLLICLSLVPFACEMVTSVVASPGCSRVPAELARTAADQALSLLYARSAHLPRRRCS